MKLSELKNGESGYIVKVLGHGGFRKRIVEMGFIRGKKVTVLLNAPLQDPVKYRIMGYEISLRRAEASQIEIVADRRGVAEDCTDGPVALESNDEGTGQPSSALDDNRELRREAMRQSRTINVALVGNPNCGKTSLFNFASGSHERVGNYSGVTVDAKEGRAEFKGYSFNIVDLPGTYSLSAYSPEELYVRKEIVERMPDVIINVIDVSNIERNLYLTTQLVDMNLRIVSALNMFDEFEARGDSLDAETLGGLFGIPLVPTVFRTGQGVEELFAAVIRIYEGKKQRTTSTHRHIHLNHGKYIERGIERIQVELQKNTELRYRFSTRYLAIKLLENDKDIEQTLASLPNASDIMKARDREAEIIKMETKEDSETAIMNAKYGIIHGALREAGNEEGARTDTYQLTHVLDAVMTNRYVGYPLFFFLLFVMFHMTFFVGQFPMRWIETGVECLSAWVSGVLPDGMLRDMIVDGAIAGVGAVIVFLPQILILYIFISFMEDSGYMARAAFIMDKLMHKMGLHGKSFIPLIMGFGCNVPAVMATRTIESRRSRLITMMVIPFMSCSARLPIYIMVTGAFFAVEYQSIIMILLYVIGIMVAVIVSRLFSKYLFPGEDVPFVMELPPYRMPTVKATARHAWDKCKQYLKKMGGIILVGSLIVWALSYFPHQPELSVQEQQEQSCLGVIGKAMEPLFAPQGFDWKLAVSLIAGVSAKEITASSMGVLNVKELDSLTAFAYLVFVLLYFPCIATLSAIKSETGSWRWAAFAAAYTTLIAWVVSAIVKILLVIIF